MANPLRGEGPVYDRGDAPDVGPKNKMSKNDTSGSKSVGTGSSSVMKRAVHGTRPFGGDVKRGSGK